MSLRQDACRIVRQYHDVIAKKAGSTSVACDAVAVSERSRSDDRVAIRVVPIQCPVSITLLMLFVTGLHVTGCERFSDDGREIQRVIDRHADRTATNRQTYFAYVARRHVKSMSNDLRRYALGTRAEHKYDFSDVYPLPPEVGAYPDWWFSHAMRVDSVAHGTGVDATVYLYSEESVWVYTTISGVYIIVLFESPTGLDAHLETVDGRRFVK